MSDDTSRWLDSELPDELRAALSSMREDDARPVQLTRLRAGIENAIGSTAFGLRDASGFGGAAEGGRRRARESREPSAAKLTGGSSNATPIVWTLGAVIALGLAVLTVRVAFPFSSPALEKTFATQQQPEQRESDESATRLEAAASGTQPGANPSGQPGQELAPRAAAARAAQQPASRSTAAGPRAANAAPVSAPTLAEELASLDRIRSKMATPASALAAAAAHATRFRNGALIPERELLQLEGLLRAGRIARAQQLSKHMSAPSYPYRAQALQLLANYGATPAAR
jgi:hypothetical protein